VSPQRKGGDDGRPDDEEADPVDELYAGPPDTFVARRDALAASLRAAGDRPAAAAAKALRRPVVAAWAANALTRTSREAVREWVDLGSRLRAAQEGGDAAALREASRDRARLSARLLDAATRIAADSGVAASDVLLEGVRSTLDAAIADPEAAEQLLAARLVAPLEPVGFGFFVPPPPREPAPEPTAKAAAKPPAAEKPAKAAETTRRPTTEPVAEQRARERRRRAEAAVATAQAAHEEAQAAAQEAQQARDGLAQDVQHAREALRDLERRLAEATLEARSAEKAAERAANALAKAQRVVPKD
jgi:hypothetical protein